MSISNDGKLCCWSLENLNIPVESYYLINNEATNKSVYATCLDLNSSNFKNDYKLSYSLENSLNIQIDKQLAILGGEDGVAHSLYFNKKK